MEELLDQIIVALQNGLYHTALFVTLALPDICGALESSDGHSTKDKYQQWFNTNMSAYPKTPYAPFTGEDCYLFRCGLLHQGTTSHPKGYSKIYFYIPEGSTRIVAHKNLTEDATGNKTYNIDVDIFCHDMVNAVRSWLRRVETTPAFKHNYQKFIRRYPPEVAPINLGVSIIG